MSKCTDVFVYVTIVNVDKDCDIIIASDFNSDIRNLDSCDNMDAFLEFLRVHNHQSCTTGYVSHITHFITKTGEQDHSLIILLFSNRTAIYQLMS